jgi:hypothetical protein
MATKPFKLKLDEIKPKIDAFLKLDKPTRAGLIRMLGCCQMTLHRASERLDGDNEEASEVALLLRNALIYIAEKHEERLYDKGCVGSIFYLKSLSKYLDYREYSEEDQNDKQDMKLTIEVINDREDKEVR